MFIVIINFLVLFFVFILFNPKMFCIELFSEFVFSFLSMGSKVSHVLFYSYSGRKCE